MCGIAGWAEHQRDITSNVSIIKRMTDMLSNRGPNDSDLYVSENVLLGHRRLVIVDPQGGKQPMTRQLGDNKYTIVYNGELYNTEEVREKLKEKGHYFKSYSDTEVLLVSYIEWGIDCLKHINGIYAFGIWDEKNKNLFLARDPLGVKPLFYVQKNNRLLFASEIKALLEHPMVEPVIDKEGLLEVFGLGPSRSLGSGVFKDIKEIPPAHYLIYNKTTMQLKEYWKLEAKPHMEDFATTIEHTRNLLIDAIERQLVSDVPVCTFLSGGLDSSAISSIAANAFERDGKGTLNTFSVRYKDNEKYFKANEYQPNSDDIWAEKVAGFIKSNHENIIIDNSQLVLALENAVKANDLPGMADIDSSLYLFCKEVREKATVALSGECADEIFGGYPWFRRQEDIKADTFPWLKYIEARRSILGKEFKDLPLEEYVGQKYKDTIKHVPKLKGESPQEARMRELFYLNIKWFMITLLNRKDRMSMANSLEVRVPFADYRLVEYAFNIPNSMKFCDTREKGLLRRALKGILPKDVLERRKSPYPKTHHHMYTEGVQKWMREILQDKNSPILQIIDHDKVFEIVETGGKSFDKPWFGQLMTGPQLIAYLIQIDVWMRKYQVKIIG
ncbi:asparagine synthase (glutamine-hydrolyzing) [Marinisporobacter balticus]|uniref:asparagine synthase (glutamine-hydrolyzing) n=1 Tax=Marinisporobacter balticus TaxID=2018667 RepID=A0A4R2L5G9_9FIRM|nr:asparagine synthase (glutamine-hydrolyzing) [Marinisporobacter balticus]TCO74405.1 asparagine synthase (glutamine-hydrolysing) [Marinisporobacter balticus]